MKKKNKGGRPRLEKKLRVNRLFSLSPSLYEEFKRIVSDKELKMSTVVNQLMHDWVVANKNSMEDADK